jgi:hypothetical protein
MDGIDPLNPYHLITVAIMLVENAGNGNWENETEEWQEAAGKFTHLCRLHMEAMKQGITASNPQSPQQSQQQQLQETHNMEASTFQIPDLALKSGKTRAIVLAVVLAGLIWAMFAFSAKGVTTTIKEKAPFPNRAAALALALSDRTRQMTPTPAPEESETDKTPEVTMTIPASEYEKLTATIKSFKARIEELETSQIELEKQLDAANKKLEKPSDRTILPTKPYEPSTAAAKPAIPATRVPRYYKKVTYSTCDGKGHCHTWTENVPVY